MLDAHYPGELGGTAIARTLFGDDPPAGRQTATAYPADFVLQRNMTTVSIRATQHDEGITYRYYTGNVQWPFGWGLSYAEFKLAVQDNPEQAKITTAELAAAYAASTEPDLHFLVDVSNTAAIASDFVLLGFVVSPEPGVNKILSGFERVRVEAGASVAVPLAVAASALMTTGSDGVASFRARTFDVEFGVEGSAGGRAAAPHGVVDSGPPVEAFRLPR